MNIVTEGRKASITYTPWFNRILMGGLFLVCAGAAVWVAFDVRSRGEGGALEDVMLTFQTGCLFIAGIGLVGLIINPAKAYVFDKGQGRGVFYIQRKFVFGTFQKLI